MTTKIIIGDCREVLKTLPEKSVHCCVTSPPYYKLRRYCKPGTPEAEYEVGQEQTPEEYISNLVEIFREVKRVLRDDSTLFINIKDCYDKNNELRGIPWQLAFALKADGWRLIQEIIWEKPNCMPESVTKRCTNSHESIFLFAKSKKYFFDNEAIKEPLKRPDEGQRKTPAVFGGRDKFALTKEYSRLHSGNPYLGTSDGKTKKEIYVDKNLKLSEVSKTIEKPFYASVLVYASLLGENAAHRAYEAGRTSRNKIDGFDSWVFAGPADERARPWHIALLGQVYKYGTVQSEYAESCLREPRCRHRAQVYYGDSRDVPAERWEKLKKDVGLHWDDEKMEWSINI